MHEINIYILLKKYFQFKWYFILITGISLLFGYLISKDKIEKSLIIEVKKPDAIINNEFLPLIKSFDKLKNDKYDFSFLYNLINANNYLFEEFIDIASNIASNTDLIKNSQLQETDIVKHGNFQVVNPQNVKKKFINSEPKIYWTIKIDNDKEFFVEEDLNNFIFDINEYLFLKIKNKIKQEANLYQKINNISILDLKNEINIERFRIKELFKLRLNSLKDEYEISNYITTNNIIYMNNFEENDKSAINIDSGNIPKYFFDPKIIKLEINQIEEKLEKEIFENSSIITFKKEIYRRSQYDYKKHISKIDQFFESFKNDKIISYQIVSSTSFKNDYYLKYLIFFAFLGMTLAFGISTLKIILDNRRNQ